MSTQCVNRYLINQDDFILRYLLHKKITLQEKIIFKSKKKKNLISKKNHFFSSQNFAMHPHRIKEEECFASAIRDEMSFSLNFF